jgi:hypothetical protein
VLARASRSPKVMPAWCAPGGHAQHR